MINKELVKIIFFDIDHTIVDQNGEISDSTKLAFSLLKNSPYKIGIATGRGLSSTNIFLKELNIPICISFDGRLVSVDDNIFFKKTFEPSRLNELYSFLKFHNLPMAIFNQTKISTNFQNYPFNDTFGFSNIVTPYNKVEFEYEPHFEKVSEPIRLVVFTDILIENELSDIFYDFTFRRLNSRIVEISSKGYSKAFGIKKVINFFNLNRENVLVFGDGHNDLEMFDFSYQSIAMGNAVVSLKEKSNFITKNVDNDGIFFALKKFDFI